MQQMLVSLVALSSREELLKIYINSQLTRLTSQCLLSILTETPLLMSLRSTHHLVRHNLATSQPMLRCIPYHSSMHYPRHPPVWCPPLPHSTRLHRTPPSPEVSEHIPLHFLLGPVSPNPLHSLPPRLHSYSCSPAFSPHSPVADKYTAPAPGEIPYHAPTPAPNAERSLRDGPSATIFPSTPIPVPIHPTASRARSPAAIPGRGVRRCDATPCRGESFLVNGRRGERERSGPESSGWNRE